MDQYAAAIDTNNNYNWKIHTHKQEKKQKNY